MDTIIYALLILTSPGNPYGQTHLASFVTAERCATAMVKTQGRLNRMNANSSTYFTAQCVMRLREDDTED